jgi:hypothetical protein
MVRVKDGDFSIGNVRIHAKVRCVKHPDVSLWTGHFPYQHFCLPKLQQIYIIRQIVLVSPFLQGVLLVGVDNISVLMSLKNTFQFSGEPFFEYKAFNFVSSP